MELVPELPVLRNMCCPESDPQSVGAAAWLFSGVVRFHGSIFHALNFSVVYNFWYKFEICSDGERKHVGDTTKTAVLFMDFLAQKFSPQSTSSIKLCQSTLETTIAKSHANSLKSHANSLKSHDSIE